MSCENCPVAQKCIAYNERLVQEADVVAADSVLELTELSAGKAEITEESIKNNMQLEILDMMTRVVKRSVRLAYMMSSVEQFEFNVIKRNCPGPRTIHAFPALWKVVGYECRSEEMQDYANELADRSLNLK